MRSKSALFPFLLLLTLLGRGAHALDLDRAPEHLALAAPNHVSMNGAKLGGGSQGGIPPPLLRHLAP
jgi:hypothetical protein